MGYGSAAGAISGPGSFYERVGLRNGDAILRVNGYSLNSPEEALEVYSSLKDAKAIRLDIKRNGKPMRIDYAFGGKRLTINPAGAII